MIFARAVSSLPLWAAAGGAFGCAAVSPAPSTLPASANTPASTPASTSQAASSAPAAPPQTAASASVPDLRALFPELAADAPLDRATLERAVLRAVASRDDALGLRARLFTALDAGDFETARQCLARLGAREELERARQLVASGDPAGALALLEIAFAAVQPDAETQLVRGTALLARALAQPAGDARRTDAEIALSEFLASAKGAPSAAAWLGASRAARELGRTDDALAYADDAARAPRTGATELARGELQRRVAEASADGWRNALATDRAQAHERYLATRASLEALLARAPADAWTWAQLGELELAEGRPAEAERLARAGLAWSPDESALHALLASAADARGGRVARLAVLFENAAAFPAAPAAHFELARARFDEALAEHAAGADARAEFTRAEAEFTRARTLANARGSEAERVRACLEHEAACRTGRGWSTLRAGELAAARDAFLSAEDVASGAASWTPPGGLAPGVRGLEQVADAFARRGEDVARADSHEDLERAARLYEFLHRADPAAVRWPSSAGFRFRDTALAWREKARAQARDERRADAERSLARARELMEASYASYADAARLAPADVRLACDAGRALVSYLQRDPAAARAWLDRAVANGETQRAELRARADEDGLALTERERRRAELEALELALGDAYQEYGVLELTLAGDARAALAWFEKSLATGPDPRSELRQSGGLVERARAALADGSDPRLRDAERWDALPAKKTP